MNRMMMGSFAPSGVIILTAQSTGIPRDFLIFEYRRREGWAKGMSKGAEVEEGNITGVKDLGRMIEDRADDVPDIRDGR
ncbi:hypothetical protein ABTL26_19745, partial [Acinetobacter baumannii]